MGEGLFTSSDNGATWTKTSSNANSAIALAPNGDFVAGGSGGSFRSTNNGQTWTSLSGGGNVTSIFVTTAGTILAGTFNSGVNRLPDGGTWTNSGELRVGAMHAPPFVVLSPNGPTGPEVAVAAALADELDAELTDLRERDDDLRSDNFFNAEKFPTITFKSKRVQNATPGGFELVGDLTIRDVTREVVLKVEGPTPPIRDAQGNRRVGATATTTINRKDFNINWHRVIETGGVVVGDEVKITLEIQAIEKKS